MEFLALFLLIVTIAVGVYFKLNTGFVAIGVAYVLSLIGTVAIPDIMAGFNISLFLMLLGVMYMFGVAQTNGTINLLARKIVAVIGKKSYLVPVAVFMVSFFVSAIGPGTVPTLAIMSVFSVALAKELNSSPIMMATISYFGTSAGGLSPIASTGIIGMNLASEIGVDPDAALQSFFITSLITIFIVSGIFYVVNKGYKQTGDVTIDKATLPSFNKNQILTLVGMLALIILVLVFNLNVGLVAFVIGTILLLLKAGNQAEVLGSISWGTIVMVTGVGVLMNVVRLLGGIDLLSNSMASIMNQWTAPAILSLMGSITALFSSQSGVVMPTLISTIPNITQTLGGDLKALELVSAIIAGSGVAGMSPLTGGSLVLSAITTVYGGKVDLNKSYSQLLKWALIMSLVPALLALLGLYDLF